MVPENPQKITKKNAKYKKIKEFLYKRNYKDKQGISRRSVAFSSD